MRLLNNSLRNYIQCRYIGLVWFVALLHVGKVSLPSHTFSWASLTKWLTSTLCTYFHLQMTTTLLESADHRNYFVFVHCFVCLI